VPDRLTPDGSFTLAAQLDFLEYAPAASAPVVSRLGAVLVLRRRAAVSAIERPPPRSLKARVESYLRDNGPSTTVQNVAALDSTPNRVCGALGSANVECEDRRYTLADDE
jgi:hypothetical protein